MNLETTRSGTPKLCDVCGKKDGFQNMNMQTCTSCGVCVHEMCYGLVNSNGKKKYSRWKCYACAAVGMEMKVNKPGEPHRSILVSSRSTECALCSVTTGCHAMHLLYDTHGKEGTPKILQPTQKGLKERVAWVHTLCAMFIGKHEGVIFACQKDGSYEGQDVDSSDSEDEAPVENEFNYLESDDDNPAIYANHHHFVVTDVGKNGKEDSWSRRVRILKEARLKCYICGIANGVKKDTFAIQCSYKDCAQAFHVGCSRWGKMSERFEHIEFNPGELDESGNEVTECTAKGNCPLHSRRKTKMVETQDKNEERRLVGQSQGKSIAKQPLTHYKQRRDKGPGRDIDKVKKRRKKLGQEEKDFEGNDLVTDDDDGDMHPSNKWSHLWVPNYRPGLAVFTQWDSVEEITQDDVERDDSFLN